MRLELAAFPVLRAALGDATVWHDGTLTVGVPEVRRLVLHDRRIGNVHLDVIHPGDATRVLRVLDSVEPLHKVAGASCAFPGFSGDRKSVV